jgi:hypothetical protein
MTFNHARRVWNRRVQKRIRKMLIRWMFLLHTHKRAIDHYCEDYSEVVMISLLLPTYSCGRERFRLLPNGDLLLRIRRLVSQSLSLRLIPYSTHVDVLLTEKTMTCARRFTRLLNIYLNAISYEADLWTNRFLSSQCSLVAWNILLNL